MKVVIIGAVAGGTKAAAKVRRENPECEITVFTREEHISYAGCGLPYFLGGVIEEEKELVVKTPEEFKAELNIDIFTRHEVRQIVPDQKKVVVRDLSSNTDKEYSYDKLVIATGASPVVPPLSGINLKRIFTLRGVSDALKIRALLDSKLVKRAVVVGGGFIGLEVAENFTERGVHTTVVELQNQVLPGFDPELALYAEGYLKEKGLDILTGAKVVGFSGNERGEVQTVETTAGNLPADLVIWATGVKPNVELAKEAGIELGPTGAIRVNAHMETNVPDIYAVGDCAENVHLLTGKPVWFPMGSTANKTGRIAALNLMEPAEKDALPGVLGTAIIKLFGLNAARTGLTTDEAKKQGYDVETVLVPANDKAHYYPGYRVIFTKLIVDRKTHKILGAQVMGEGVVDKPIDIIITLMSLGGKVENLTKLDLAYAPPFSMAMASTIVAANVLVNKLQGKLHGVSAVELQHKLKDPNVQIVDIRSEPEYIIGAIPNSINIPLGELRERAGELDPDKETVVVCKLGKRAYQAFLTLKSLGFKNIAILEGGITAYPYMLE